MILEKEQIHRYMRHIIMPEISGVGQKKLLNSSILVCSDTLEQVDFMMYYLTAMGIGKITCQTVEASDSQSLINNLKKLNPDVTVKIGNLKSIDENYDAIIIFNHVQEKPFNIENTSVILTAAIDGKGFINSITDARELNTALSEYNNFFRINNTTSDTAILDYPCCCLMGTLAAIETVKSLLQIGSCSTTPLYMDLWNYSFSNSSEIFRPEICNYKESIGKIQGAKVLIVGSGGLGSPVAYILARMGIGKLGLVDYDTVEISNLNRQILHSTDRIGMPKVESAKAFLKELNPELEICAYHEKFSMENAESLAIDYDIIVDGLDNLPTRYLLNDTCYFLKKPLIEAGVLTFSGLATAIIPDEGPCYRCTFPEVADTSSIPSCSETGVLGAVPGVMGALQAVEVIKQLTGIGETLLNKLIMYDALNAEFTKLDIYREDSCSLCGSNPTIDALKDYNFVCSSRNEA